MAGVRALVVGAGALGNEVIKNLALMGVGHLDIVDRDRVEASNLTRSVLFCTPDIPHHIEVGTPKAEFAARRVAEINPDVAVTAHAVEVADLGAGLLRRATIIFSCVDNEMARLELGWIAARLDKPVVDGGLGLVNSSSGMVSLFPGAEGPCYACRRGAERRRALLTELQGREDPCSVKERRQQEEAVVPTTPVMASVVGAIQVETGVRHCLAPSAQAPADQGWSARITLSPRVSLETFTFGRSTTCPLHEAESQVRDVLEQPRRVSREWTAAQLLAEVGDRGAYLQFDWPMTVRAACRTCGHAWEPMVRRARFRGARCPACSSDDLAEVETLAGVAAGSPWAGRTLAALGLPVGHIHEVVLGTTPESPRRHVEVTGDWQAIIEGVSTW
jgi:adenylyltransferase/sulfurtransferase